MRKIGSMFLLGLATLLPVAISFYLIWWLFNTIDGLLQPILIGLSGKFIPGIGFIITIAGITLIGFIASSLIGKKLIAFWERILIKTPFLGKIYSALKKIVNSIFSQERSSFRQAVLVEFPREGIYSIGFITNDNFAYTDTESYCLFVPTTPNPTSGFFVVVPKEKVKLLDIPVEKAFEMLISAGMVKEESNA